MRFARFFIARPVFAAVISIAIVLIGAIASVRLPISEYPEIAPPTVTITATYPGASASVIAETVATPIEQEVNGVEGMLYMSSQATGDGKLTVNVVFRQGVDVDQAQVLVQNRMAVAEPRLPEEVRRLGLVVRKASPDIMMVIHLISPDGSRDDQYLSNYATLNLRDRLARLDGVGDIQVFGGRDYAMRIWLDPARIAARGLTAGEVVEALRRANVQVAAGGLNQPPTSATTGEAFQLNIQALGRLRSVEEFSDIVVATGEGGAPLRLRDVARVELGSQDYTVNAYLGRDQAVAMPVFQRPGSNALATAAAIRATLEEAKRDFPPGVDYRVVYDTTQFIEQSMEAVLHTFIEAIVLVVLVVILFLQSWRASIIPLAAIPVSIIGTFAFMGLFGVSLNSLSMFGLILAIGIVVDDAIVVVENVERHLANGLDPVAATQRTMDEVGFALIAIALVLCAVFVPTAFITGLAGAFYQQFAVTIAVATLLSALVSLTLSPALAALLLKDHHAPKDWLTRAMDRLFGWFFRGFNRVFGAASNGYGRSVGGLVSRKSLVMALYLVLVGATYTVFNAVPGGFVPAQDKQYLIGFAQLPDGATLDRTEEVIKKMSEIALEQPGVSHAIAFPGLSINGFTIGSNSGIVFATLDDFDKRTTPELSGGAIAMQLNQKFAGIQDAFIAIFPPPPVNGLGSTGGFKLQIEDRAGLGYKALDEATKAFLAKAYQTPELAGLFSSFQINVPQLYADLDRAKAQQLGVKVTDVFETLQIYLGSLYVNDFNAFGRTYSVRVQADSAFRAEPEDIGHLKVRSQSGEMIPLAALLKVDATTGPERTTRYNGFLSADINGGPAPGFSSGQAQEAIEKIAAETLPAGIDFEWTDLTYQQILAGNSSIVVFPLALLLVYLVLAAQYESLTLPIAIIMIVPMGVLAALAGVWYTGGDNNIFTQIGLVVLVGLSAKNAILIVEFARELEFEGRTPVKAAIEASRLRLRPILMTSMAFIMGVVPLVLSTGAGAEMRAAMGLAVFCGMIGVTFFGIFMTPVFYVLLRRLAGNRPLVQHGRSTMAGEPDALPAPQH